MTDKVVGILGGGQLGRMLAVAASRLNVDVIILDTDHAPAKQVVASRIGHVDGSFTDAVKIKELASKVDVLTIEIEHVDVACLEEIQKQGKVSIHPGASTIRIIQDKLKQKQHLATHGAPILDFMEVDSSPESILEAAKQLGFPLMLKSRTFAYDGRGNFVLPSPDQAAEGISFLKGRQLYAEKWVHFAKEVAVIVVRTASGDVCSYPAVETVHKENICHLVFAPLRSHDVSLNARAQAVAESAVKQLEGAGVFAVEMFMMENGTFYINEIAPRPHNSGHYTIEACLTSQYENHLRAILSLPLGSTSLKVPAAAMLNILGSSNSMSEITRFSEQALSIPGASVHLYGKAECRKGRKMGHVTITADSDAELRQRLRPLLEWLPSGTSKEDLDFFAPMPPSIGSGLSHTFPLVGVIMGSDSDLPIMTPAARILESFGVPYELTIVSAHRTPDRLVSYARSASPRGLRVIIAGAGGAAHLPGMVAAMTALPVIGVPVKGSSMDGLDSLYSIVQMPRGIPVATVAINNAINAGLLAVRILTASVPHFIEEMDRYMERLESEVHAKVDRLETVGWAQYETEMKR